MHHKTATGLWTFFLCHKGPKTCVLNYLGVNEKPTQPYVAQVTKNNNKSHV